MSEQGRRRHYGEFYDVPGHEPPADGRPTAWVHGNCQAESLRLMLDGPDLHTVRVPAVHELTADDLPHLARLLARTDVLVTQPVRDDYHDLPVGTAQLLSGLSPRARSVVFPVLRFAGLYPYQVIVRPPADPGLDPPLVAYHDLRTLVRASGGPERPPALEVPAVLAVADRSLQELREREERHGTVVVSDLFTTPGFDQMRTINHPGNPVFAELARRVRRHAGLTEHESAHDRPLLDGVHTPRLPAVAEAFELPGVTRSSWCVDGVEVSDEEVQSVQLRWYADHQDVVAAGVRRHADAIRDLRLHW